MRTRYILSLFLTATMSACATPGVTPEKSQLEIREFQTRSYETNDTKMVMKALLNVLQDDGYIVKNIVTDLGFLVAEKEVDIESGDEKFFAIFFSGAHGGGRWKKGAKTEVSANVSEYGKTTKVRVNFIVKIYDNRGDPLEIKKIEDQKFYQEFFTKVDKGIFIQKEKL